MNMEKEDNVSQLKRNQTAFLQAFQRIWKVTQLNRNQNVFFRNISFNEYGEGR